MKSGFKFKHLVTTLLIAIAITVACVLIFNAMTATEKMTWSEIESLFENGHVKSFTLDMGSGDLDMTVRVFDESGAEVGEKRIVYELGTDKQIDEIFDWTDDPAIRASIVGGYEVVPAKSTPAILSWLPLILILVSVIALYVYMMNSASGKGGKIGSFGRSKAKSITNDKNAVKFADVAGADEEKEELTEIVEFLKDPAKFIRLGAKIPHGVLLVGPPGTGKTLLAKAVAGEAGVPFYSISGSDFVEMYVGVGASRVRDLFDTARKHPASIIFIDEIDAVGRQRGTGLGGGHDEREQTLNQLLVEMDGFGGQEGIIIIAATNRPDVLDPALLRPGRFDRRVTVNYPDIKGREEILRVHIRNKPIEGNVDLRQIAQRTVGFTGADLANLMNEAALLAAKRGKNLIGMQDISDSYMKVILGPQKKSNVRTEHDNKLAAYHEAGHAIASYCAPHADPVKYITIIPAGQAGGVTLMVPDDDKMVSSRNEMLDRIVVDLGGRVAEELMMDDVSTGASSDIQQATKVARNMVTRYGMSDKLGTILYGSEHSDSEVFLGRDFSSGKNYSEKTAAAIDDEIRRIVDEAKQQCRKYLEENIEKLKFVAEYLLKYESMDGDIFELAMKGEHTIDELAEICEEKKRKSEEENADAAALDERIERMIAERDREVMNRTLDPSGRTSHPSDGDDGDGSVPH